jgi:2-polyprenyl-3-methyl-5-hydroxy-6-metoxy-1,4-benzoquinol methylase
MPSHSPDPRKWNAHYQKHLQEWLANPVRPLLEEYAFLLPSKGRAFVAAAGIGKNAHFLASHGLHVIAADISFVAMKIARQRARGLPLFPVVMDLSRAWLPPRAFEVILNFYFLERSLFPLYQQALIPGGILFIETFLNAADSKDASHYLNEGELLAAWEGYEILHHRIYRRTKRVTQSERLSEQLIVRKPKK